MVVSGNMSAGNMGMFRNRIINGDMRIDQRNNGAASTTTGTYKLDRWTCLHGGGTVTGSVRRVNLTSADPPYNSGFINAIESTVSQTGGTWGVYFMFQRIEGNMIYDIINQPITVSFWAKGNSAFTLTVDVDRTVGGGGGDRVAKNVSITTSWTYYTLTWAIPSPAVTISSSTLTSDYLDLNFTCGIQSANPYGQIMSISMNSTTSAYGILHFPVCLRNDKYTIDVPTTASLLFFQIAQWSPSAAPTALLSGVTLASDGRTIASTGVNFAGGSGLTVGATGYVRFYNTSVGYIAFNAEL